MRIAPGVWAKESFRTYVGNATAVRDYRSQIRGNRALVLLTLYLTLLLLLTGMIYTMSTGYMSSGYNDGSISYVQYQLSQFYNYILMLLAGFIAFVTPALSARRCRRIIFWSASSSAACGGSRCSSCWRFPSPL